MSKLTIELDEAALRAISGIAKVRELTVERMTAEIVTSWPENMGAIDGELASGGRLTRHTPTEGQA
jgi:hypothetical protein